MSFNYLDFPLCSERSPRTLKRECRFLSFSCMIVSLKIWLLLQKYVCDFYATLQGYRCYVPPLNRSKVSIMLKSNSFPSTFPFEFFWKEIPKHITRKSWINFPGYSLCQENLRAVEPTAPPRFFLREGLHIGHPSMPGAKHAKVTFSQEPVTSLPIKLLVGILKKDTLATRCLIEKGHFNDSFFSICQRAPPVIISTAICTSLHRRFCWVG